MHASCILALAALLLAPAAASAQEEGRDAAEAPSASAYMQKLRAGIRQAVAQNFDEAVSALREAVQESPTQPHAYYYLGEVQRMHGDLDDALASFRTGQQIATRAQDDLILGRCLQAVAETLERKAQGMEQARQAWQQYASFADSHRMVANPEIARARIQAIDQVMEQEAAYVAVRERIAERERFNAEQASQPQQAHGRRAGH